MRRFLELNKEKRVRDTRFHHLDEIESLFEKALEFYRGVKERDRWMLENVERLLAETGREKAVVITGGFHAGPFKRFFKQSGYNYALITPKMTTVEGRDHYIQST